MTGRYRPLPCAGATHHHECAGCLRFAQTVPTDVIAVRPEFIGVPRKCTDFIAGKPPASQGQTP